MRSDAAFRSYAVSLNVPQKEIYYVSWNIDAAEGLGILKTEDAATGKTTIFTTGSMLEDLLSMLKGLQEEGVDIIVNGVTEMEKTATI